MLTLLNLAIYAMRHTDYSPDSVRFSRIMPSQQTAYYSGNYAGIIAASLLVCKSKNYWSSAHHTWETFVTCSSCVQQGCPHTWSALKKIFSHSFMQAQTEKPLSSRLLMLDPQFVMSEVQSIKLPQGHVNCGQVIHHDGIIRKLLKGIGLLAAGNSGR